MHALLIGIDNYPNLPKLKAAVADVNCMNGFLANTLGVPNAHIRTLKNAEATCQNIISGISDFTAADNGIREGDRILIYFAGHGSTLPIPSNWSAVHSEIQCLVAYDAHYEAGSFVEGVLPDITLASLLQDLADAKGNNIVSTPQLKWLA
jgi:uncharacterized caspase-like protein